MTYSPLALSPVSSLSSDSEYTAEQTRTANSASGRGNVFARLQALFPSSPSTTTHGHEHVRTGSIVPKFLKIRVMSWNHHESLPKGDLVELLGEVTPVDPNCPEERTPLMSMPQFAADGKHPYHLVVVAGQECPSLSGIPLGLGAGFKLLDKDKEKESLQETEPVAPNNSYGWSAILEDWYSHAGSAHVIDRRRGFRNVPSVPSTLVPPSASMPDLKRKRSSKAPPERKGPYELLIKERMMGLYLAIYVHRDIKHLVKGTSKSAVTAGLIGGRVGNKGGVGISVNLDGSSLLFINAHLAAHEGKVMHRLNNMQKIKANLLVDDFLDKDDPRVMAEDVTDKFDYTFICGDLNFRLDISRLHADWLISRKDYSQALAFDQLRNLMQNQQAFVGFQEAPINFPPTFKYDVLRTIKHGKSKRSGKSDGDNTLTLVEIEERERDLEDTEAEGEDGGGEAGSMASSAFTSVHSKVTTERDVDEEDYFMRSKSSRASTGNLVNKVWAATAAHKAKHKWMGLLTPGTPIKSTAPSTSAHKRWSNKIRRSSLEGLTTPSKAIPSSATEDSSVKSTGASLRPETDSNPIITLTEEEIDDQDRGVYDTSSKKRVPSWCDRILYKSTVEPDPEEDEPMEQASTRPRTRVGNFFASAFRMRPRRSSHSSHASVSTESAYPPLPPPKEGDIRTHAPSTETHESAPFSRFVQGPKSPTLKRPNSIDDIPRSANKPALSRSITVGDEASKSRRAASLALPMPRSKTTPAALETTSPVTPIPVVSANQTPIEASPSIDTPPPVPPKEIHHMPSRWRFLPFFNWNSSQSTISHEQPSTEDDPVTPGGPPIPPRPKKGDIVCLNYDSLDDRGMRRLEGRSDHRPIIGSYAVYL